MKLPDSLKSLFTPKSNPYKTLLLTDKMLPLNIEHKLNIVLSPSLYWFREEVLPAKNESMAKNLAPSFFDSVIDDGEYEYMAIARGDKYWLFAYSNSRIMQALDDAGITAAQVHAIYFAQTECLDTDEPLSVDEHNSLVSFEGSVCIVPKQYTESFRTVDDFCSSHPRSRHRVGVNFYSSGMLSERQLFSLTIIAIVFVGLYLADFLLLKHQLKQQRIQELALKEHYNLPKTSFELKSLMSRLKQKEQDQQLLRERFRHILKLPLKKGESVLNLKFTPKKVDLQIALKEASRAEILKNYLEKSGKIMNPKVKNKIFFVSLSYE